ncbi:MAG: choice-of-anchor Q domain-containing protein, partial [Anaerolineales bacterium]
MTRSYRIYLAAFFLVVLGSLLIYHYVPFSAASPAAVTLDVDTTLDSNDPAYQGCTPGPNDCSLRGAISLANGDSANDYIISLPAGVYTLTLAGPNEDGNATGDLDITTGSVVTLIGVTADSTIIQAGPEPGAGIDRVFDLNNSTLALQNLTVRHGLSGSGGGFYVRMSALTLSNVIVSDNRAIGGLGGGGINGTSYAAITITNSTFRNNTTDFDGGAIVTYQSPAGTNISGSTFINNSAGDDGGAIFTGAPLTLVNSTFSKNIAQGAGGGIYFNGWETMWVTNSTFSDNFAPGFGGGIVTFNLQGTLNMYNTIIANSLGGGDCDGGIRGQNIANLIEDGSCNPAITGDPNLGPLQDNGGATLTYALLSGSPAIDAANDEVCPATDQRGEARPQDGDGDGTAACDIGSFEVEEGFPTPTPAPPPTTLTLVVDTTLDSNDPAYQACTAAPNDCTLRGAISHANNDPVNEYTLSLPAGSYTLTLAGDLEDNNATGDLDIASGKTLTVTGVAPASSIIQAGSEPGNGIDRVFHVLSGANLTVQNVSV